MLKSSAYDQITFRNPDCPVGTFHSRYSVDPHFRLTYHRETEFQLIKHGRGAYLIAGERYSFVKDTLVFIPPKQVHRLILDPGVEVERVSLIFLNAWLSLAPPELRRLAATSHRIALTSPEMANLDLVLRRLESELCGQASGWKSMVRLLLREFLELVARTDKHSTSASPPQAAHPALPDVVNFINTHFSAPLKTETIARRAGFSASHFSRLFKRHTGLGIKQYILHRRILEAKDCLEKHPALKVSAISEMVGFSDFALFNRAFKAITCATPSEYRAIVRSKTG